MIILLPYGSPRGYFSNVNNLQISPDWIIHSNAHERQNKLFVCDLTNKDHIILYSSTKAWVQVLKPCLYNVSIFVIEPRAIQVKSYWLAWIMQYFLFRTFTYDKILLKNIENSSYVPHGGCFLKQRDVKPMDQTVLDQKIYLCSIIASKKRKTTGQRLRHHIISNPSFRNCVALGRGYSELKNKAEGHIKFMYTVVIENSRQRGYFTEKLIDAMLCHCIPIYWGDPDIGNLFNISGMILCDSLDSIMEALDQITTRSYYERLPHVEANYNKALGFMNREKWICDELTHS